MSKSYITLVTIFFRYFNMITVLFRCSKAAKVTHGQRMLNYRRTAFLRSFFKKIMKTNPRSWGNFYCFPKQTPWMDGLVIFTNSSEVDVNCSHTIWLGSWGNSTMVLKSQKVCKVSNYRPISLTLKCGRILEHVVDKHRHTFLLFLVCEASNSTILERHYSLLRG